VAANLPLSGSTSRGPLMEHSMRATKRRKALRQGLEAHYVSQARPAIQPVLPASGHWVIRPMNSRTTTRVWRFL
jgi:hypothetical protein